MFRVLRDASGRHGFPGRRRFTQRRRFGHLPRSHCQSRAVQNLHLGIRCESWRSAASGPPGRAAVSAAPRRNVAEAQLVIQHVMTNGRRKAPLSASLAPACVVSGGGGIPSHCAASPVLAFGVAELRSLDCLTTLGVNAVRAPFPAPAFGVAGLGMFNWFTALEAVAVTLWPFGGGASHHCCSPGAGHPAAATPQAPTRPPEALPKAPPTTSSPPAHPTTAHQVTMQGGVWCLRALRARAPARLHLAGMAGLTASSSTIRGATRSAQHTMSRALGHTHHSPGTKGFELAPRQFALRAASPPPALGGAEPGFLDCLTTLEVDAARASLLVPACVAAELSILPTKTHAPKSDPTATRHSVAAHAGDCWGALGGRSSGRPLGPLFRGGGSIHSGR